MASLAPTPTNQGVFNPHYPPSVPATNQYPPYWTFNPQLPGPYYLPPPPQSYAFHPRPPPFPRGTRSNRSFRGRGRGRPEARSHAHFECKACSKEYKSEETYAAHLESHQKCDKCEFCALPRVLKEHRLVHLLPDVLKFTSPEEIRKWREERRKNWPTRENVARKKQLAEEKVARGETALTPLHRYIRHLVGDEDEDRGGRGKWRGRGRGRGRGFRGRRGRGRGRWSNERGGDQEWSGAREQLPPTVAACSSDDAVGMSSQLVKGKAPSVVDSQEQKVSGQATDRHIGSVEENEEIARGSSDRDGSESEVISQEGIMEAIFADAGGLQVTGLSSRSGDVAPQGSETGVREEEGSVPGAVREEVSGVSGRTAEGGESSVGQGGGGGRQGQAVGGRKRRPRQTRQQELRKKRCTSVNLGTIAPRKPTLLEKLLAPEVRKEQNILLQCIRYVVRTNFLGHRQQPQQQESSSEEKEGVTVSAGSATVEEQNSYNNEPSESISDT